MTLLNALRNFFRRPPEPMLLHCMRCFTSTPPAGGGSRSRPHRNEAMRARSAGLQVMLYAGDDDAS